MRLSHRVALVTLASKLASAACECGYQTNTGDNFQFALLTNFSTLTTFTNNSDWETTSVFRQGGAGDTHPVSINYTPANVQLTNARLRLTCSAYNASTAAIDSAQISTRRDDILHGSFRATYSVSGGSGANGALFFYADDSQEIDIESLTRNDPASIHFTNQPSSSVDITMPNGLVRTSMLAHRIDWTSQETRFYVNNMQAGNFSTDVPTSNGSVYMNMWGDGGSFTGSPPTSDAVMEVQSIELYFNTSSTTAAAAWAKSCQATKVAACTVDSEPVQKKQVSKAGKMGKGNGKVGVKVAAVTAAVGACLAY